MMFKIIIAGGRDFNDYELLKEKCSYYLKDKGKEVTIISGTAKGADTLGEKFASEMGYEIERHPADWDKYGKRAGYLRNEEMAKSDADALIAFWDGKSKGTKHMIDIATREGLIIKIVNY